MKDASSVLGHIFKDLGMEDRLMLARLQRQWPELFDAPLSLHTCPASLNKGVLVINVDSPLWMQQLKYFKPAMLSKLDAYSVSSIELRHGRVSPVRGSRAGAEDTGRSGGKRGELSAADAAWMEHTLSEIEDAELREQIKQAIERSFLARK